MTDSMYYYHMQDPYVQAENETEAEEAREKQLTYKGLARDDAEEFDTVLAYAEYKASALATQMKSGVIDKIRCGSPTRPRAITAHTKMCAGLMKNTETTVITTQSTAQRRRNSYWRRCIAYAMDRKQEQVIKRETRQFLYRQPQAPVRRQRSWNVSTRR